MLYNHITELIGNTPLLRIDPAVHQLPNVEIYAKLETYNPFGSLKDRVAWGMLQDEIEQIVEKQQTIIEFSSGNTGKALAVLASLYRINYETITNRIKVPEVHDLLRLMGASIEVLPGMSECPDPNDPNDPLTYLEQKIHADPSHYFHTDQYRNVKNYQTHYEHTGREIFEDLGAVDYFFGALGTAGSTRGVSTFLKEQFADLQTVGIVAEKGDFIPGLRNIDEMSEVGIFEKTLYQDILPVDAQDALSGMLTLISQAGVLGGPSSGAVYYAMVQYLKQQCLEWAEPKKVVFIVCDRVEWYLSYIQKRRPELFEQKVPEGSFWKLKATDFQHAPSIAPEHIERFLREEDPLIVDTRGSLAYKIGHLPNSLNIPDDKLADILTFGVPFPHERTILFVCPKGDISKKFAFFLQRKGYKAYSLEGGIIQWRKDHQQLLRSPA
ncbi:Trp-synth-beta_II and RHOD domain-containing protein [Ktedonobacteria bacterium brp13]|nr:Trp-synth-beta_II and RHOD domain-containing protein [Ktedonobacteria bacterium brp13]